LTTAYHAQYWAHLLTLKGSGDSIAALSRSISNARLDLNPHQVDAALFALRSPLSHGAILADEVGLGKTIEAGIILAQRWAERRRKILLILPAFLRQQWQQELEEKFFLPSRVLETTPRGRRKKNAPAPPGPLEQLQQLDRIALCSYEYASKNSQLLAQVPWDLVVIDEAHRLRNVYKKDNKVAARISGALRQVNKLLLTATPLQNSLMELYGLVSTIDPHVFGDERSFREQFLRAATPEEIRARDERLRERLKSLCKRTLRKQVVEYVRFTPRVPLTQDFLPTDPEQELYERVSAYLQRPQLIALPNSQRALITLVLRKLLASSTFAIAATLRELVRRLEAIARLQGHLPAEPAGAAEAGDADGEEAPGEESPEEDFSVFDEAAEEWDDEPDPAVTATVDPKLLKDELAELRSFAALAERITANAKGTALLKALSEAFTHTDRIGAARKAVVFTESRRTQKYLFDLLTANGFAGKVVLISGTNDDPASKAVYQAWLDRHAGQEIVTGNPAVDLKAALVEEFRERAVVCVATEAAAEGVNLQFCNLVVNYHRRGMGW
jgi:hypothetical protein